ncbi:MAG TPA: hypothetical protein VK053_06800 [Jiangellaceae bacterium]|nr:hypothetical protein [Jiangellaceae bacterium]
MSVTPLDTDLEDLALIHALETEIRALLLEVEFDPLAGEIQAVQLCQLLQSSRAVRARSIYRQMRTLIESDHGGGA